MARGWKLALTVLICVFSVPGDWGIFDVLWPLFLWMYREEPRKKWLSYGIIAAAAFVFSVVSTGTNPIWRPAYTLGILCVPPLLYWGYSGLPGSRAPFHKWVFYAFYPAHLLILGILRHYL